MQEKVLSKEAKDSLLKYPWPGNVRELENIIERAMILTDGDVISMEHIATSGDIPDISSSMPAMGATLHELEKNLILSTFIRVAGNRTKAATLLGISIRTLRNKLNEYTKGGQISDVGNTECGDPDPEEPLET